MTDDTVFPAIDRLIGAAAPERLCELASLWKKYSPQFILQGDQPRFTLEVAFGAAVIFTNKTLLQIWLLGFAAWRAVEAYAGIIRCCAATGMVLDFPSVSALPDQFRIDVAFDRIISAATALGKAEDPASVLWPEDVPPPGTETFSIPDKAAYDLICIATAYIFLHEVKHLAFAQDENGPESLIAEEMACDRFAKDFLLSDVPAFSRMIEKPAGEALAKRLAGIAIAVFVVLENTPPERWGGSGTHPPIAERLKGIFEGTGLSPTGYPWNIGAALLLAKLRAVSRPPPQLTFANEQALFEQLVSLL
jgi:hypothetical protein